jgi:hypothetical protein
MLEFAMDCNSMAARATLAERLEGVPPKRATCRKTATAAS